MSQSICAPFEIASAYKKVVSVYCWGYINRFFYENGVQADNSLEQAELLLSGLVVKREGYLQVANRIYERVFDRDWVERILQNLRPYREAIAAWLASGRQDDSRLLQGQALQAALTWKENKRLSADDDGLF